MADAALGGRWLRWWIDHLNWLGPQPDTRRLRKRVQDFELKARKALLVRGGPQAVAAFDREVSLAIIGVVASMTERNPAAELQAGWPELGGGGWKPKPGAADVDWPDGRNGDAHA